MPLHAPMTPFRRGLAAASLLLASAGAPAATCGWLATSELDRLFPDMAPWRVLSGGEVGRCQFMSRPPPAMFGANQVMHDSPEAAAQYVANLRPEMSKSYDIADEPAIGENGFLYLNSGETGGAPARFVGYAGHRGTVAVIGSLSLRGPATPAQRAAGIELVQAALSVADDAEALAAARDCPWFDAAVLDRLLPGGNVTQQVLGETSCMATDGGQGVLTVSIREASPPMLKLRSADCTWEDVPALGEHAALGHTCTGGNPRTTLQFVQGDRQVVYNLVPGTEPTEAQRQALLDLGTSVQGSQ